jgi:hypothetical protein
MPASPGENQHWPLPALFAQSADFTKHARLFLLTAIVDLLKRIDQYACLIVTARSQKFHDERGVLDPPRGVDCWRYAKRDLARRYPVAMF